MTQIRARLQVPPAQDVQLVVVHQGPVAVDVFQLVHFREADLGQRFGVLGRVVQHHVPALGLGARLVEHENEVVVDGAGGSRQQVVQ